MQHIVSKPVRFYPNHVLILYVTTLQSYKILTRKKLYKVKSILWLGFLNNSRVALIILDYFLWNNEKLSLLVLSGGNNSILHVLLLAILISLWQWHSCRGRLWWTQAVQRLVSLPRDTFRGLRRVVRWDKMTKMVKDTRLARPNVWTIVWSEIFFQANFSLERG